MDEEQQAQLYRTIGTRIRQAREKCGLSQGALAALTSISRVSVVNIEKGQQHTPLHVLFEIAQAVEIDMAMLLPSLLEVFGEDIGGVRPSRVAYIEAKTSGRRESRDHVLKFVKSVSSNTKGQKR
ncbi:MAG: helix-turn-helix transcriptional regulator [Bacteroidetes bacterium]|nr:helix-turn-helix transcriptional regulator [Bacteroidota bacterium]